MTANELKNSPQENPDQYEDEIELIDLLRVVWKWRYLIIGGTVICMIVAGTVSLLMPEVYRSTMVIDSGVAEESPEGKTTYLIDPKELETHIKDGLLRYQVFKALREDGTTRVPRDLSFDAEVRKGTNLIEVSCEAPSPDLAPEMLRQLYDQVTNKYSDAVAYHRARHDEAELPLVQDLYRLKDEVELKKVQLGSLPDEIKMQETEYARKLAVLQKQQSLREEAKRRLQKRAEEIKSEIETVAEEIGFLTQKRTNDLEIEGQASQISPAVLIRDIVQDMREHLNSLRNQLLAVENNLHQEQMALYGLEDEIVNVQAQKKEIIDQMEKQKITLAHDIKKTQLEIETTEKQIFWLKGKSESVRNAKLVEPPAGSETPVKPKMSLHIALSGTVGIFIMLFLAFFIEYVQKSREEFREKGSAKDALSESNISFDRDSKKRQ